MDIERTLLILKPEVTIRRFPGAKVIQELLDQPIKILGYKRLNIDERIAKAHYKEHEKQPFFSWLIQYVISAPVMPMILEGKDIIKNTRNWLGETFVQKASPDSLRGKYGIWGGINVAHASDSIKSAKKEIDIWVNLASLNPEEESRKELEEYTSKWIRNEIDYTKELRALSKKLVENNDQIREIKTIMRSILLKECIDVDLDEIERFLISIIKNCIR
ncbi:MAG: nucleoside-diphosphate kinase [Candidatus Ranarchaeia archaeon]